MPDRHSKFAASGRHLDQDDHHQRRRGQAAAALAAEFGVNTVESPVTCGVERAISGDFTLLVGGDAAHIEACREVFDTVASKVVHTGPLGSASVIKLITNLFAYVHLWAMGEGLMLGKKAGIDVAKTQDAIKASYGNSFVAENEAKFILDGTYNVGFTMALAAKDLHLTYELGAGLACPWRSSAWSSRYFSVPAPSTAMTPSRPRWSSCWKTPRARICAIPDILISD